MSEETVPYRAGISEAHARLAMTEAELDRWKRRVRELEDAILLHRQRLHAEDKPSEFDRQLWCEVETLWT